MLSQDEIDSLMLGVSGDEEPSASSKDNGGKRIRAFDPNDQQRVVHGRLHAFDIINERFARRFRMFNGASTLALERTKSRVRTLDCLYDTVA